MLSIPDADSCSGAQSKMTQSRSLYEKIQKLDRPESFVAFSDHRPHRDVERGKERCRAVTDIGAGSPFGHTGGHGQNRLLAIQRLNRQIVVCDRPVSEAMDRIDQCVASFGVVFHVRSITSATCASDIVRGRPGRYSSVRPSIRSFTKRLRHLPTVCSCTPSRDTTTLLGRPSAHHHPSA